MVVWINESTCNSSFVFAHLKLRVLSLVQTMIGFGNREVSGSARTPLITGWRLCLCNPKILQCHIWKLSKVVELDAQLSSNYILRGSVVSKAAWDSGSDDLWEKFWAECIKTGRLPVSLEKSLVSCATSCVNDLRTNSWQVTTSL